MGKPDEFDPRLKAYLHRGAATPPPAGMEARIVGAVPRRQTGWVLQVVAAAAVLVLAIGLGIVVQRARQSVGVTPTASPVTSPITKPTPYPTPTTSGAPYPLLPPASMHMIDASTGWAAGSGTNRILRTTDGGSHWNDATPRGARAGTWITFFLDGNNAWIASSLQPGSSSPDFSVAIYRTADGGRSWQQPGAALADKGWPAVMDFVDNRHGWLFMRLGNDAGSEGVAFYGTLDGGATWSKLAEADASGARGHLPLNCFKVPPVFVSASIGWMPGSCNAGGGPYLYVTHDGGRTWDTVALPLPVGDSTCLCTINSLRFADSRRGNFVLTIYPGHNAPQNYLYASQDGGASWQLGPMLPANSFTFYFLDPTHGWTLDAKTNNVLYTADGGQRWAAVGTVPSSAVVIDLQFVTSKIGWALGAETGGASILKSVDGGLTWTVQLTP